MFQIFLTLHMTAFSINKSTVTKLIQCLLFSGPFLEVIRSEETTGPVMNLALSSVFKFLCYGLIGKFLH